MIMGRMLLVMLISVNAFLECRKDWISRSLMMINVCAITETTLFEACPPLRMSAGNRSGVLHNTI